MMRTFVESSQAVTLLGGAPVSQGLLREVLEIASVLVAADGGARHALNAGISPMAVIGDLDSLTDQDRQRLDPSTILHIPEQDSTDFDKALRNISAPLILAIGFTGARIDHELAVYSVLVRRKPGEAIVLGTDDLCFHAPDQFSLAAEPGTRVSLFPMRQVTGRSQGLRWPIDGLTFTPWERAGTSNESDAPEFSVRMDGPGMLTILPRELLRPVVSALAPSLTLPTAPQPAREG